MAKADYIKCITSNYKNTTYCGRKKDGFEWAFVGVEHAITNNENGSRLLPCKNCVGEINRILLGKKP